MLFFPRHAVQWHLHEPVFVRRLLLSLGALAVAAGVTVHLFRWVTLTYGPHEGWAVVIGAVLGRGIILPALATAHLGNYPVSHWLWRAPLFGAIAGAAESLVAALLILAGVEPLGSELARGRDWWSLAYFAIIIDTVVVSAFAALLAGVVQLVRSALLRRDRRARPAPSPSPSHHRRPRVAE